MKVLVINCGSSSLKYQLIDSQTEEVLAKGLCERIGIDGSKLTHKPTGKEDYVVESPMKDHQIAVKLVLDALTDKDHGVITDIKEISAVGHRVLHAGQVYSDSIVVNEDVKRVIRECFDLGPLHNPANLIGIEACEAAMPGVPQVAVFDTAFHQTMPKEAYMYALPYEYYENYGIRRYGFHGTSHKYVSRRVAALMGKPVEELKIITCHLGNGSSISAIKNGEVVDTSMGFTPHEGLLMGTRCGDIDATAVLYLMKHEGFDADRMDHMLNKESGLLGVSGVSSDFRELDEAIAAGDADAKLARDIFIYRGKKYIGSYVAAMNGVDAVVFTAGIGENGPDVREEICADMDYLGIKIDTEVNNVRGKEVDISAADAKVRTWVVPTNEELAIAEETVEAAFGKQN